METIKNQEFGGERPLYRRNGLKLDNITIHPGESSVKECHDIIAQNSRKRKQYVPNAAALTGESAPASYPVEVSVGGATIFVTDIERFEKV